MYGRKAVIFLFAAVLLAHVSARQPGIRSKHLVAATRKLSEKKDVVAVGGFGGNARGRLGAVAGDGGEADAEANGYYDDALAVGGKGGNAYTSYRRAEGGDGGDADAETHRTGDASAYGGWGGNARSWAGTATGGEGGDADAESGK